MSNRDADIDIISMAQQARPNDIGQIEFLRAQLIALERVVVKIPSAPRPCSRPALSMRANSSAGPLANGVSSISFIFSRNALLHFLIGTTAKLPRSARPR